MRLQNLPPEPVHNADEGGNNEADQRDADGSPWVEAVEAPISRQFSLSSVTLFIVA
jgi:hypothetical protein